MTPTLWGRLQTRIFLAITVGAVWTGLIVPVLPVPAGLATASAYRIALEALGLMTAAGLFWELLYHLFQQARWDKDWPSLFMLVTVVNEAVPLWLLLHALHVIAGGDGWSSPALPFYASYVATTWVVIWLFVQGPIRVAHVRWRFEGGQVLLFEHPMALRLRRCAARCRLRRRPDRAAPKGRGDAWTEKPGTSDERLEAPRRGQAAETLVDGVLCHHGHFCPPHVRYCVICGDRISDPDGPRVLGERPPLGVLIHPDGTTQLVDEDLVVLGGLARVQVAGWEAMVSGASSAVVVIRFPGGCVLPAGPRARIPLLPGADLCVGDERIRFEGLCRPGSVALTRDAIGVLQRVQTTGGGSMAIKGIRFEHPIAFWFGVVACSAGVVLHLPMYYDARTMGYRMAGMRPDAAMLVGMALIGVGLLAALYGLVPRDSGEIRRRASFLRVRALDDAPLRWTHVATLLALAVAVTIDGMKPITLSFVAPGMTKEYGLKSPLNPLGHVPVSWLPLAGIGGTVIGSWLWGWLGDRIGRRASILFAALLFVTTAICGAMPGFSWNLLMCFFMGVGVGGMLPIAFTLIAETVPSRHRGWLMVLIGGNIAAAYALTSWLSGALIPHYSWRIMWLIGLPTGLLLIGLNHWIPESPRYLLASGEPKAAEAVMARYGAAVVEPVVPEQGPGQEPEQEQEQASGRASLLRGPLGATSVAITVLGASIGLIAYGFQLWIPTNLEHLGYTTINTDYTVRNASLIGLPLTALVAWAYGFWSSKRTVVVVAIITATALSWFAISGNSLVHQRGLLTALLVIPLAGSGTVVAILSAYAAEIYPTSIRSRGTGHAAAMTKAGGVLIIALVVAAASIPSIAVTALIGVIPLVMGAIIFAWVAPETFRRPLDEIARADLSAAD